MTPCTINRRRARRVVGDPRERTMVELTVLGCDGSWPGPGGTGSSYLLTSAGFHMVLDLGGGALGRLQERIEIADIGAVCISHAHHDHYADLFPLSVARYWRGLGTPGLEVLVPPGFFERVSPALMPGTEEAWSTAFDMRTLSGGEECAVGPFSIQAFAMTHVDGSLGFRISADGTVLAYTGDTGPCDAVGELAAGADIFLADATHIDGGEVGFHLTARQAATFASVAGVGCLVLTHLEPGVDPVVSEGQAREVFDGRILVAHPGLRV
jgi:ribonuclease BN (tRNA processing enzyme)